MNKVNAIMLLFLVISLLAISGCIWPVPDRELTDPPVTEPTPEPTPTETQAPVPTSNNPPIVSFIIFSELIGGEYAPLIFGSPIPGYWRFNTGAGKELKADYTYTDTEGDDEGTSLYRWLWKQQSTDPFYEEQTGESGISISNPKTGLFIFEVTPVDVNGAIGEPLQSEVVLVGT